MESRRGRDALWKIVHDRCVPNETRTGQPAPCTAIDLGDRASGEALLDHDCALAEG